MSLIKLKSKTEPKYFSKSSELKRREPIPEATEEKIKTPINSASSLQIGNGVSITGTIKADNEVTIEGTLDGDVDCHCLVISKTGNIKGKVKTETMTIEGKAEGEITICGVCVETDDYSGKSLSIEPIRIGGVLTPT